MCAMAPRLFLTSVFYRCVGCAYDFLHIFAYAMILDVARHKLFEALITLVAFALATTVCTIAMPSSIDYSGGVAPLGALIGDFQRSHNILATIIGFVLVVHLSMMATRATVRSHLYVSNSFAVMSIMPLMLMMLMTPRSALATIVVALLTAEAMRRLFYAFSSQRRKNAVFTAMLALGTLPLVDCSLLVVVATLPLIVIALRCSLRDLIIAVTGMLLPIFIYAYVVWCSGGAFGEAIISLYDAMLAPSTLAVDSYLTLPRIVSCSLLLLMGIGSVVLYMRRRMSMTLAARHIWRFMLSAVTLLAVAFALLPSTTESSYVVVAMLVCVMSPMLLLQLSTLVAILIYVTMMGFAIAAL